MSEPRITRFRLDHALYIENAAGEQMLIARFQHQNQANAYMGACPPSHGKFVYRHEPEGQR